MKSPDLEPCSCDLEQHGYTVELDSGAKVFVDPELYEPVLEAIRLGGWVLYPEHVIVNIALESTIIDSKALAQKDVGWARQT